jgi:GAF domain-containing protein
LGQFQGTPACTKLYRGIGVCGTSWEQKKSIVVEDVNSFEGHIACSAVSKSEIVIPIFVQDSVIGVLDIDSANYSDFDWEDEK